MEFYCKIKRTRFTDEFNAVFGGKIANPSIFRLGTITCQRSIGRMKRVPAMYITFVERETLEAVYSKHWNDKIRDIKPGHLIT